jgi:iron complex transport system substrate-binding protein
MVGWNHQLMPKDKPYILPGQRDLPVLGGWFGGNGSGNREVILAARPQIILSIGAMDATSLDFSNRLQQQVGIPVWVGSGELEDTPKVYEQLGKLLGEPDRAARLAEYARRTIAEIRELEASIPANERKHVYYAEGPRGLMTNVKTSMHTQVLRWIGAENVVTAGDETSSFQRASVSLEQVIAWQPDSMVVCRDWSEDAPFPEWIAAAEWKRVPAVANGRVWQIPNHPFNWFDRPPSSNRLLGLKWTAWALYPERVKFDIVAETRTFYRLFYHYELSDADARAFIETSRVPLPSSSHE